MSEAEDRGLWRSLRKAYVHQWTNIIQADDDDELETEVSLLNDLKPLNLRVQFLSKYGSE